MYRYIRFGEDSEGKNFAKAALAVYFSVILFAITVSLFRPIYYVRYTIVICGLLFLACAVLVASLRKNLCRIIIAVCLLSIFAAQTINYYCLIYDPSANEVEITLNGKVEETDVFLFDGVDGYVVTVKYPRNISYFYNVWGWNVQDAYRAFGPNSYVLDSLDCEEIENLPSRVWTIGRGMCYEKLLELGYSETESQCIHMLYHNNNFEIILMEIKIS